MGMIKRIIGRTSRKILSKIVPNARSQELIVSQPAQPGDICLALHKSGAKQRAARLHKRLQSKSSGKDTAVADALLLAVKNHLPPVQFHHVHGPNAQLSASKCAARRTHSFCQALVFSSRCILPNERVYIKVLEIAKGWSGTIRFGFTALDPATLACRMPKHACPDMTNAGHTWARALADEVVRRNSVIHFSYNSDGFIHYGINNQDCGIFHANVNTSQTLWFIVDIYGLTAAVELIDPRVTGASGAFGALAQEAAACKPAASNAALMEQIFGHGRHRPSSSSEHARRRQSRKAAAPGQRQAAPARHALGAWPAGQRHSDSTVARLEPPASVQQWPNLSSASLPNAQQNIYSPMPGAARHSSAGPLLAHASDAHHYHQIIGAANNVCATTNAGVYHQPPLAALTSQAKLSAAASAANLSNSATSASSSSSSSADQCHDICGQFESVQLSNGADESDAAAAALRSGQQTSLSRSSKSTPTHARHQTPVPAARRRAQQHGASLLHASSRATQMRTQTKALNQRVGSSKSRPHTLPASSSVLSPGATTSQTVTNNGKHQSNGGKENVKPKIRHSIKQKSSTSTVAAAAAAAAATTTQQLTINRDSNNSTPPSKDCPICFERPINCVLYQCGHMCTCYECGVKQWKTQSRTCPICRTIIKDVIKTYMS